MGNKTAPLEFGIFTAPDRNGKWYRYSKYINDSKGMTVGEEVILEPDSPYANNQGEYTYMNSPIVEIELKLGEISNSQYLKGKIGVCPITKDEKQTYSLEVSAEFSYVGGVGTEFNTNTFFMGVTAPQDNVTLVYNERYNSYLKHVIFQSKILVGNLEYPWYPVDGPKSDKYAASKNVKRDIISKTTTLFEIDKRNLINNLGFNQWELTTKAEAAKYLHTLISEL